METFFQKRKEAWRMIVFSMSEVGKDRMSAKLAAEFWADRAVKVTLTAENIKVAGSLDPIPVVPHVPAYWLAGAWREFGELVGGDRRAVWFSDGVGDLRLVTRTMAAVSRMTGAALPFLEVLLWGGFSFTARFPAAMERRMELFVQALGSGQLRLGRNRSTHGRTELLGSSPITVAEARAFEAEASARITPTPSDSLAAKAREIVRAYDLSPSERIRMRRVFIDIAGEDNSPAFIGTELFYALTLEGNELLRRRTRAGGIALAKAISEVVGGLLDMKSVREFFWHLMA